MDKYRNFAQLKRYEVEHLDYRIQFRVGGSRIAVVAPHGGKIERGTSQIAKAIAGEDHSFYGFEGIKPALSDNRDLHITSNNFDEPRALSLVRDADVVISIHGAKGMESAVYTGGLDQQLGRRVLISLNRLEIFACNDPSPTRQGKCASNICNRGRSRKGLQLELTFGLRKRLFGGKDNSGVRQPTELFSDLVYGIRRVL